MLAILAAVGALALAHGPAHHHASKRPPAATPAPAQPHYNGAPLPRYWMPCPCHVHPHPPWLWQKVDFVAPADEPAPPPNTMPRRELTPGETTDLSTSEVCSKKWGKDERHVTAEMKAEAFHRYGFTGNTDPKCIPDAHGKRCEIDHLISRELGGADTGPNIWPEPYGGPYNAHDKDRVENRLHVEVCDGRLTLLQAQTMIRADWQQAYRSYFGVPASAK